MFVIEPFVGAVQFLEDIFNVVGGGVAASLARPSPSLALPAAVTEDYPARIEIHVLYAVLHIAPVPVVEAVEQTGRRVLPLAVFVVQLAGFPGHLRQIAVLAGQVARAAPQRIGKIPVGESGPNHAAVVAEELIADPTFEGRPCE